MGNNAAKTESINNSENSLTEGALPEDHYASHLAEVNENNTVVTTEDIVNSKGVLICHKGTQVNSEVSKKILNHQLAKPLEEQVEIENTINEDRLSDQSQHVLSDFPDLGALYSAHKFDKQYDDLIHQQALPPLVLQKLTVLKEQLPRELDKAIFCAGMASLIAREMGHDQDFINDAFQAGLLHDIGFIHIDPNILNKKGALTSAEWRAIQCHVVIGQVVLTNVPQINNRVIQAVLHHHERCDGSGYPRHMDDSNLDQLSQIVAMADSVQAIRVRQFEPKGRNLRDLVPYLQMNAYTHYYEVYQAMMSLLKRSNIEPTTCQFADLSEFAKSLLDQGNRLHNAVEFMEDKQILTLTNDLERYARTGSLHRVAAHLMRMIVQSGMVKTEVLSWLDSVRKNPSKAEHYELCEIELMFNELNWQLNSAFKCFMSFLEDSGEDKSAHHRTLKNVTERINDYLR